jgi:excisionase family DNA binding protein
MQNLILSPVTFEQLQMMVSDAVKHGIEQLKPTTSAEPTHPDLLTRKQVCELLNITPPTLHVWTKEGRITAYHINTRVRYKRAEVMSTLQKVVQTKFKRTY